jgi:hypothetical protein
LPPRVCLHLLVDLEVTLDDPGGLCSVQTLVGLAPLDEATSNRLEACNDGANECVTLLFQLGQDTGTEEDLG